ncbi:MAG: 2-amino-4-hydroxy-6-hydroxymethyldihydropteridine diphosphokinase [Victivallales bacterium]|jgi:2-amino-4-hydroxy-6-hydroxymethyldihydropteridine diphosphokinase|nr:2-amino-4-hydroxy-6-hydroxymethyldihydropteridine diphosphokinase [Victivallales bacterium]
MLKSTKIAIALGGNLGNPEENFRIAAQKLIDGGCEELQTSRIYRSAAVDCVANTPDFCNAALCGKWKGSALELLHLCQRIEREAGRPAEHSQREARTLDLDIILFGDEVCDTPELTLPHPRAQNRRFVLEPLSELIPDDRFPDTGMKIAECLRKSSPKI